MPHVTTHHGVPVRWTLLAHGRAAEQYVDWYAVGISTAASAEGYECGMVVIMNEKLYRALEDAETCPEGVLPETMGELHKLGHRVILRLMGGTADGDNVG